MSATVTKTPVDQANRLAALNPLRSICVTAPAGSGKTELLSQRVLRLLARVEQPEEILAITFTRKAAGEMHHRIMSALFDAASQPEPEEAHRQLSWRLAREALAQNHRLRWQLLENPSRLKVQTIDSLCASLTRQMPLLSQFGAQPQLSDYPEPLYQLAAQGLLERLEQESPFTDALLVLLDQLDNDFTRLQRLLVGLLQRRDQWLYYLGSGENLAAARQSLEQTLAQVNLELLDKLNTLLRPLSAELTPLMDYAGSNLKTQQSDSPISALAGCLELPHARLEALPEWSGLVELLLTKSKATAFRKRLDVNCGFPTKTWEGDKAEAKAQKEKMLELIAQLRDSEGLLELLEEFRYLPGIEYPQLQWELLESLLTLLPVLVAELQLIFQQQGVVDFTQVSLAALQGLGEQMNPSELALKLDYQLSHILIDEFQDTSSTQYRLLERLTDGWQEHNARYPEVPRTLFIVGDGMQSIYAFREAKVGLFLEARRHGVNGIKLDDLPLSVNFRSSADIVEWNNRVFQQAFPAEESLSRGAVSYERATAFAAHDADSGISVLGFTGEEARQHEAKELADIIESKLQQYPDDSIGVLVRSRNHLQELIAELGRRQVPWNATEIDSLSSYACIADLLALTKSLCHLGDRLSWLALLRSPWFGLNNHDLWTLLAHRDSDCVWVQLQQWQQYRDQLSSFTQYRLPRQIAIISSALAERQRYSFREWLEGIWVSLGGSAALEDERELEMAASFFDLLEKHQVAGGGLDLAALEDNVTRLYAAPQNPDSPLQLMTIHKSKGLEFDTVILPSLERAPRSDDRALLMWREYLAQQREHSGLLVSPLPADGQEDATYTHLRYEQGRSQALENTRLLYVAATRAVRRLVISFTAEMTVTDSASSTLEQKPELQPEQGMESQAKPPAAKSLLATVWPSLQDEIHWFNPAPPEPGQLGLLLDTSQAAEEGNAPIWSYSMLRRLSADWQPPRWSFPNPLADYYLQHQQEGDNQPLIEEDDQQATLVGTVVHSVLELLHKQSISVWAERPAPAREQWLKALLRHHSSVALDQDKLEKACQGVVQAVETTLKDPKGRWLLAKHEGLDFTELSLSTSGRHRMNQRVVDRLFCDDEGVLWIVDYKTNRPQAGESEQDFVARCSERYRQQLLEYSWYVSQWLEQFEPEESRVKEVRKALYFTAIPRLQVLD